LIIRYLRDERRNPWACIVILDPIHIGWYMCHNGDFFPRKLARRIAIGRAEKSVDRDSLRLDLHDLLLGRIEPWQTRKQQLRNEIIWALSKRAEENA